MRIAGTHDVLSLFNNCLLPRIGGHLTPRFDADQKITHHFLDAARVIGPEKPVALLIWIKRHLR
jgi:hypothetical protein